MNTTGCPPGLATDAAFMPAADQTPCSATLASFWGVLGFLCAVRFLAAARVSLNWWIVHGPKAKDAQAAAQQQQQRHRRWPLLPLVHLSFALTVLLVVVLIGVGAANAENAAAWSLASVFFLPFAAWNLQSARVLVRLGAKVAGPAIMRSQAAQSPASQGSAQSEHARLASVDWVLAALFASQFAAVMVGTFILIVLGPAMPGELVPFGIAALALKAAFVGFTAAVFMYQLARVHRFLRMHERNVVAELGKAAPERVGGGGSDDLARAKKRLSAMFLLTLVLYTPMVVVYVLLSARVLPWSWVWILAVPISFETAGNLAMQFFVVRPRRKRGAEPGGGPANAGVAAMRADVSSPVRSSARKAGEAQVAASTTSGDGSAPSKSVEPGTAS